MEDVEATRKGWPSFLKDAGSMWNLRPFYNYKII